MKHHEVTLQPRGLKILLGATALCPYDKFKPSYCATVKDKKPKQNIYLCIRRRV